MDTAFVFPGQGSQSIGMLGDLLEGFATASETLAEASEVLGYDLAALISDGPKEDLDATVRTQPAMLAAGVATWRVWRELGGTAPTVMAGHSLGEYSALVCAGSLPFAAAVKVVERRATLMQEAVPEGQGAMTAVIGLTDEQVEQACEQASEGQVLAAVNYNAPGQVVVAGERAAVERAGAVAQDMGARRVLPLPVSVPSHCDLMRPAADAFAEVLAEAPLTWPDTRIVHNAGEPAGDDAAALRDVLCKQLYSPVRWRRDVEAMCDAGVSRFVECGPGKVLAGLVRRTRRDVESIPLHNRAAIEKAIEETSQ